MKLFEQLKSNASRMAVYAILVATALCGIAAPVYALNGEKGDVEPAYMASTVKDRYKAFSGDTFYRSRVRHDLPSASLQQEIRISRRKSNQLYVGLVPLQLWTHNPVQV